MLKTLKGKCLLLVLVFLQLIGTKNLFSDEPFPFSNYVKYTGPGGIGYRSGYTTYELLIAPTLLPISFQPFIDGRAHWLDNGRMAANAGFGARFLMPNEWILGGNFYYDYRNIHRKSMHQVGVGLEILSCNWDFRANVYIPVSGGKFKTGHALFNDYIGGDFALRKDFHYSFYGGDAEIGTSLLSKLPFLCKLPEVYFAIGPYYFKNSHFQNATGVRVRLAAQITDYISVETRFTHDHIFRSRVQGVVNVEIPFSDFKKLFDIPWYDRSNECCDSGLCEKLIAPPFRNEILPTKKDCFWKCNYDCPQI